MGNVFNPWKCCFQEVNFGVKWKVYLKWKVYHQMESVCAIKQCTEYQMQSVPEVQSVPSNEKRTIKCTEYPGKCKVYLKYKGQPNRKCTQNKEHPQMQNVPSNEKRTIKCTECTTIQRAPPNGKCTIKYKVYFKYKGHPKMQSVPVYPQNVKLTTQVYPSKL